MVNKNLSGFAIWYYLLAFYVFRNSYLFCLCFVVKNNAVNAVQT